MKPGTISVNRQGGNWVQGSLAHEGAPFTYEAKVFSEPSHFGINDGRVSKLFVRQYQGPCVFKYDRGHDLDAAPPGLVQRLVLTLWHTERETP